MRVISMVSQIFSQFCHKFFMWQLVSGRNKIVDSFKSMILPLTSRHIIKL